MKTAEARGLQYATPIGLDLPSGDWPTWLAAEAFAGWYKAENVLRRMGGDDPLPPIPDEVLAAVGLTRWRSAVP
jgi:hypothetical protein